MNRIYSLAYLTSHRCTPAQAIRIAAQTGYQYVGLRLWPNAPGAPQQHLLDQPQALRETLAAQRDTGVGVFDLEIIRIGESFDPHNWDALYEVGAQLKARAILVAGDAVAFVVPWGLMFGRLANWVNGELPGRPLPEALQANPPWWSVKYPNDLQYLKSVPAQLEPLRELAPATERASDGSFITWVVATAYDHGSSAHEQVVRTITPALTAYYPNNFLQALAEGPCILIVMWLAWLAPRRAGTISGIFFATYGVLRYATEQFREADSPVIALGFLTLPMLLSITMVAVGVMFFFLARKSEPIGGLIPKRAMA